MKEQLEALRKELNERIDKALADVPTPVRAGKYAVGQYFKYGHKVYRVEHINGHTIHYSFIDGTIEAQPCFGISSWMDTESVLLSGEEIKAALVKEAEKRGFKEGVRFKSIGGSNNEITCKGEFEYEAKGYHFDQPYYDVLWNRNYGWIYHEGKWATIIKEPEVTIAGEKVCFLPDDLATVGGKRISKMWFKEAAALLCVSNVSGIEVSKCSGSKVILKKADIENVLMNWK